MFVAFYGKDKFYFLMLLGPLEISTEDEEKLQGIPNIL